MLFFLDRRNVDQRKRNSVIDEFIHLSRQVLYSKFPFIYVLKYTFIEHSFKMHLYRPDIILRAD